MQSFRMKSYLTQFRGLFTTRLCPHIPQHATVTFTKCHDFINFSASYSLGIFYKELQPFSKIFLNRKSGPRRCSCCTTSEGDSDRNIHEVRIYLTTVITNSVIETTEQLYYKCLCVHAFWDDFHYCSFSKWSILLI